MAGLSELNMLKIQMDMKLRHFFFWSFLLLQFFHVETFAAPIPGISSLLKAPSKGISFDLKGFYLHPAQTGWELKGDTTPEKGEISVRFLAPQGTGMLSVKTETLKNSATLESYSKKWIKEYSSYGFDLLGSKPFIQSGTKSLVIDLFHKKTQQQVRQVILLKDKTSVIMTCSENIQKFEKALKACNSIIRTFRWL
jgi:hypothetical protein